MIASLERILGEKIESAAPVSGGDIADSQRIITAGGTQYFAKMSKTSTNSYIEEAAGLRALAEIAGGLRIPLVHQATEHFLVLEWIETKNPSRAFWETFGTELARFHKVAQDEFGFEIDNHLGTTPQTNPRRAHKEISWGEYFAEYRLKPLLAHKTLSVEFLLQAEFQKALPKIQEILRQVKEPPSLVHGDLWGGNFLCDLSDRPVLIDPAPYRGHREVDLAMTELFGGFAPGFYGAYEREFPRRPGYESRRTVYNLYHLLNHWLMFGAASYGAQTMAALRSL